jgi:histidinol dehydrogenase
MKIINFQEENFDKNINNMLSHIYSDDENIEQVVKDTLKDIKDNKQKALLSYIKKFDNWSPDSFEDIKVSQAEIKQAYDNTSKEMKQIIQTSFDRIKKYHEMQKEKSWMHYEDNGNILGQKVTPLDRVGLYVPGGKAAYPSSLLMNAIPAIVAGVQEIIVVTPTPNNEINPLVLATAYICDIKEIYKMGGASAIASLAFGLEDLKSVDMISGPGNAYVASAKKMVFGMLNIDMIAGPSEIGIIADEDANIDYICADLLSQAEHDELARSILITHSSVVAKKVKENIQKHLDKLDRKEIASKSINDEGIIIISKDLNQSIEIMNKIAPEHLEVLTKNPFELLPYIKHAGAIFLGENTPEPIGDYIAGPNHTLPTSGSARFFSPLSVQNFMKKSSIIYFSKQGIQELGKETMLFAKEEGLDAHAKSIEFRLNDS